MNDEQLDSGAGTRTASDGRVELTDESLISDSPVYNKDLSPVPIAGRYWTARHFAALWAGMACNIPTYMTASALVADGMTWWQALITVLLGNIIVLVPIMLNSHPGTKYGIPFPVLIRSSYGIRGSNLPALMRALVACGWFGINAWLGGQALFTLIKAVVPTWPTLLGPATAGHTPSEWISFLVFWAVNVAVIYRGMDFLKKFETLAAPFVFALTTALAVFMVFQAHGLGSLINARGKYLSLASFLPVFVPAVTAMIGSWSTLSLNMPDFTRFSRSQKDQVFGQVTALPAAMTAFTGMGVVITSAGSVIYPNMKLTELWNPVTLVGQFSEPLLVASAMFTIMLATLSVNVAANLVSPANDLSNCFPNWISFKKGAVITGLIGLAIQPWRLLEDPHAYVFTFLQGYAGGLASIAGVMIVDYWIVRKRQLQLADLYLLGGSYWYDRGWNWSAVAATMAGCCLSWIGLAVPCLRIMYDYSWFLGLSISGIIYWLLARRSPTRGSGAV
jgi:nucleobase:cation symporter-1, NCS1 family